MANDDIDREFERAERETYAGPVYIAEPIADRMLALQHDPPPDGDACPLCGDFRHLDPCAPLGGS